MDIKIFRAIHLLAGRSNILDLFMILLSNRVRYVYLITLAVMFLRNEFYRKIAIKGGISALIVLLIHFLIKLFYFRPRPFLKRRVGILIPSKHDSSFPSKHTILVFAISTSILMYQRALGLMMSALSLLTGFSRIWVGHHYPSDIVGSAVIGSITSIVVHYFSRIQKLFYNET